MTKAEVFAELTNHCVEISTLFLPGAMVTVVVRNPSHAGHDADWVVTRDNLHEVISAILALKRIEDADNDIQ